MAAQPTPDQPIVAPDLYPQPAGHAQQLARGLREALHAFAPQIVLSDVNLPGFSGAEALQITRALRPGVPVVFLTGSVMGLPGEELPVGDGLVYKDALDQLPDAVRQVLPTL